MKTLSACALLWFSLLPPFAAAQQPATPDNPPAASVAGTTWAGADSDGDYYQYFFLANGTLNYTSPTGFWKNGTWKQDGNVIYMETNNKYSEYQGAIWGTHMEGKAWNVKGRTWTWVAEKK